jgi:perosamine synthetase
LGPGDEVILPGFGFLAGANMTLLVGATPVFAEVDTDTWLVTAREIEPCITSRTKAIVVIHTYGNVCDMDDILSLAKSHDIRVIEDAAEALGSCCENRPAGTMGDIGTFSFQATKTITTGEGGLVATRHRAFAEKMALFRSHGLQRKTHYWHDLPGHNFRLTNLQAALGYAQAQHWEDIKRERRRISESYTKYLKGVDGVVPQYFPASVDPVVWAVAVRLRPTVFTKSRDQIMAALQTARIETRPGFFPASLHPYFNAAPLPQCEALSRQIISLPAYIGLDEAQIEYVVQTLVGLRG